MCTERCRPSRDRCSFSLTPSVGPGFAYGYLPEEVVAPDGSLPLRARGNALSAGALRHLRGDVLPDLRQRPGGGVLLRPMRGIDSQRPAYAEHAFALCPLDVGEGARNRTARSSEA